MNETTAAKKALGGTASGKSATAMADGRRPRIALACGGTGGHTFPGIATARVLTARGCDVVLLQAGRAVEAKTFDGWDGAVFNTGARRAPASIPGCIMRVWREFGRVRPDVLVAMGSYTSVPPAIAAWMRRIPVVIHEANAAPGSANAFIARFAAAAGIAFPEAKARFQKGLRTEDVGMPLRAEFAKGAGTSLTSPDRFSLLVMGGSQGALRLNEIVAGAVATIRDRHQGLFRRIRVTHIAGTRNEEATRAMYAADGLGNPSVEIVGFSNDMARLYAEADFCISRAGASSCMELAMAGLPALFVPLPHLAADHQTLNAKSMAKRGGGDWIQQDDLSAVALADYIAQVADDPDRRRAMRDAMLAASRPDATERFADLVMDVVRERND